MIIGNTAGILSQTHDAFSNTSSPFLDSWTMLTFPLVGTLNFVAFCSDPTVHSAIKKTYLRLSFYYSYGREIRVENNNNDGTFELVNDTSTNNSNVTEIGDVPESATENEDILLQRFVNLRNHQVKNRFHESEYL
ncbi:hypothetical protein K502DRAFT_333915 [Neoconidiobolus thromboides FSU 785]|nr:hypothetical protein K502DRAFT_333915 [Neoconidiobolus thromboides FSU 785]